MIVAGLAPSQLYFLSALLLVSLPLPLILILILSLSPGSSETWCHVFQSHLPSTSSLLYQPKTCWETAALYVSLSACSLSPSLSDGDLIGVSGLA